MPTRTYMRMIDEDNKMNITNPTFQIKSYKRESRIIINEYSFLQYVCLHANIKLMFYCWKTLRYREISILIPCVLFYKHHHENVLIKYLPEGLSSPQKRPQMEFNNYKKSSTTGALKHAPPTVYGGSVG